MVWGYNKNVVNMQKGNTETKENAAIIQEEGGNNRKNKNMDRNRRQTENDGEFQHIPQFNFLIGFMFRVSDLPS